MENKLIVIQGYLAAGKSTFARQLSTALKVPCFVKDTFKSALCESIELASREESSRFSAVTFDGLLYIAEQMLEAGQPLILEGNFTPPGVKKKDEAGALQALLRRYHCRSLAFRFTGTPGFSFSALPPGKIARSGEKRIPWGFPFPKRILTAGAITWTALPWAGKP